MAKKTETPFSYSEELKALRRDGPGRLYFIYGREDYLAGQFIDEIRKVCFPEGENEFSCRIIDGETLVSGGKSCDFSDLESAVNSLPFFTDRSMVLVKNFDINACREGDAKAFKKIVEDIPDFCTLVFKYSPDFSPDGRGSAFKALKASAESKVFEINEQSERMLVPWIQRRFKALDRDITADDAEYLLFFSGKLMTRLIPEMEKIASFSENKQITRADIDATAMRIPEAKVFELSELLLKKQYNSVFSCLADILSDKSNHPIMLCALLLGQLKSLYIIKLCEKERLSQKETMERCGIKYSFAFDKLNTAARNISLESAKILLQKCVECDYSMKSSGGEPEELFAGFLAEAAVVLR